MTIWKFPPGIVDSQELHLPKGARVLTIQSQYNKQPMLWALVDPEEKEQERWQFVTLGTGHQAPPDLKMFQYFSTYQIDGGALVFHVFLRRVQ